MKTKTLSLILSGLILGGGLVVAGLYWQQPSNAPAAVGEAAMYSQATTVPMAQTPRWTLNPDQLASVNQQLTAKEKAELEKFLQKKMWGTFPRGTRPVYQLKPDDPLAAEIRKSAAQNAKALKNMPPWQRVEMERFCSQEGRATAQCQERIRDMNLARKKDSPAKSAAPLATGR